MAAEPDAYLSEEDIIMGPSDEDICRVCRLPASEGRPLFHPCVCTGSIRHVHQDCLLQWLHHSGKSKCELCHHEFKFAPIYRQDMPHRLPMREVVQGLTSTTVHNTRHWLHLSFVAFMWLIIVPICIARIYRFLLFGSMWSLYMLPISLLSLENWFLDMVYGLFILTVTVITFVCVVWLKDQVLRGGHPNWLVEDQEEMEARRWNAVEDRLQDLDRELNEIGEDARRQRNHPQRVEYERQIQLTTNRINEEVARFESLSKRLHSSSINEQWLQEMELMHQLGVKSPRFDVAVECARERLEKWKEQRQGESPTEHDVPEHNFNKPLFSSGGELDQVDLRLIRISETPAPLELSSAEREELQGQLKEVQAKTSESQRKHEEYLEMALKCLRVTDDETDEELPLTEFHPEEQEMILRVRDLKRRLIELQQREREFIQGQQRRLNRTRRFRRFRERRWLHRWLHNENEFGVPRRRNRANIGAALAGLARENPEEPRNEGNADLNEEMTWSKLLGLDGSYRFLEHVLWVICMNAVVVFLFVYLPYQFGYIVSKVTYAWQMYGQTPFSGVIATYIGYLGFIGLAVIGYAAAKAARIPRLKTVVGFVYVALKVGLILSVEAGLFPLMCGWWMDICSFSIFGTVWKDRQVALRKIPGTITFLHWLAGMVYIFYFASFVMLLREILRPGVLWFLRNLNDQNFHPIQEMISLPATRQVRRFLMSSVMFGSSVMVVVWLPVRMVQKLLPGFLPYNLTLSSSIGPLREVQLELVLLHVVLPTLLEHSNTKAALLKMVQVWIRVAARVFNLQSYLLDGPQAGVGGSDQCTNKNMHTALNTVCRVLDCVGTVVDMRGQAMQDLPEGNPQPGPVYNGEPQVLGPGFAPFKPYLRPKFFHLKLTGFLSFTIVSLVMFSCFVLTIPVLTGRFVLSLVGIESSPELYTAAIGFYTVWILSRVLTYLYEHVARGLEGVLALGKLVVVTGGKCVVAGVLLFGVIPLMLGLLCDLIIFTPLRVPLDRTPVYFLSTDWALGLLHTKCVCGAIWLGNSPLKQNLDRMYRNGIRNMNLTFIIVKIALPITVYLSLALALPYIFSHALVPQLMYFGLPFSVVNYIQRRIYPYTTLLLLLSLVSLTVLSQCKRLYQKIRDDRYLIGQRLVNYNGGGSNQPPMQARPSRDRN